MVLPVSAPTLAVIVARVKVRPTFRCVDCGATAPGDAFEIETADPASIPTAMAVPNSLMPVGWAGYGRTLHRCPKCSK